MTWPTLLCLTLCMYYTTSLPWNPKTLQIHISLFYWSISITLYIPQQHLTQTFPIYIFKKSRITISIWQVLSSRTLISKPKAKPLIIPLSDNSHFAFGLTFRYLWYLSCSCWKIKFRISDLFFYVIFMV